MKVLDLFSGIGGFSYGLEMAGGFETVAFCEIDPFCREVLRKHWPEVPCFEDVTQLCRRTYENAPEDEFGYVECSIHKGEDFGDCACIGTDQFLDEIGPVDVIVGGFPCQDISVARTAQGVRMGLEGSRSGLWCEFSRIVGELGPEWVLVENSAAITGHGLLRVLGDFTSLGYDTEWFTLPACSVGAPHQRSRLFLVAYPNGTRLQGLVREKLANQIDRRQNANTTGPDWIRSASRVLRSADGVPKRMDRLRSIGNSVVPQVVCEIGRAINATRGIA